MLLVLTLILNLRAASCISCLMCDHVPEARDCSMLATCGPNEICYSQKLLGSNHVPYFKLGCVAAAACSHHQFNTVPVGKRDMSVLASKIHDVNSIGQKERATSNEMALCLQCCDTADGCNVDLCGSPKSPNLRCLSCPDVSKPAECDQVEECSRDYYCFVHKGPNLHSANILETRYEFGCMSEIQCWGVAIALKHTCAICCNSTDFCNSGACDNWAPQTGQQNTASIFSSSTAADKVPTHPSPTTVKTAVALAPQVAVNGPDQARYNMAVLLNCATIPPAQAYEWKLNGLTSLPQGLMSKTTLHGSTIGINTLNITRLTTASEGTYTCIAHTNGHVIQASHVLRITAEAPTVHIEKGPVVNNFSLKCTVYGYPTPKVSWSFLPSGQSTSHGIPPGVAFNESGDEHVIFVASYNPADHDGAYTCMATNSLGSATATVNIP